MKFIKEVNVTKEGIKVVVSDGDTPETTYSATLSPDQIADMCTNGG